MSTSYDASVALDRKLTQEESRELKIHLMPYFHATGDNSEVSPEDINDLLDYAFAMVNNQKSVEYVIKELVGMEMEFCNPTIAEKVGSELSGFLQKIVKGGDGKVVSLKSTSSGNALTMSGALGASRLGGRNKNSGNIKDGKANKQTDNRRDDRRGDRNNRGDRGERNDWGGRGSSRGGGRSTHKEAFDRLANSGNNNHRRERDNDRGDRRRRDDDRRDGRGGRGGRGRGRRDDRRDGDRFGGRGDRDDRASGNRRPRDEYENQGGDNQDFMSIRDEGRGRGRGRGRGGPDEAAKRPKYDDQYDGGYGDGGGYYDDGYGYGGHHGYGGRGGYGFPARGGRGRGRFGGRGGRGRGRGRGDNPNEGGAVDVTAGGAQEGGAAAIANASDAASHPSPLVQASYSGGGGGYGGRGGYGGGYGYGR